MAEKPDFDKIFANKATSVHEWDKDDYDTGWGFLGETPPPYELFDSLQRENDTKTKYLYERAEEINTDLTQDINNLQSDLNSKYSELKTGLGSTNTALQQHNVDENAHANLFKRALVTEAKTAANTVDWNTLTESRTYKISGATFAADKHQPVGAVGTGELVVLKNGDDTIVQVYYANSTEFDKAGAYHRVNVGGAWTDWVYNITNKGGTVTGDFNINGKLTVDSLDIKNNFTVAGGTPVTGDDLQKVQDQIIAPEQTIYVDNVNGSDANNGSSTTKAVKTMARAYAVIKKDCRKIIVRLKNEKENPAYDMEAWDFYNTNVEEIEITPYVWKVQLVKPKLNIKYGKLFAYGRNVSGDYHTFYWLGNIAIGNISKITINTVDIQIDETIPISTDYNNFLFKTNNLSIISCAITFEKYTLLMIEGTNNELQIDTVTLTTNSSYLVRYVHEYNPTIDTDINTNINNNQIALYETDTNARCTLTAIVINRKLPTGITDLGNSGISDNVGIIFKNF